MLCYHSPIQCGKSKSSHKVCDLVYNELYYCPLHSRRGNCCQCVGRLVLGLISQFLKKAQASRFRKEFVCFDFRTA